MKVLKLLLAALFSAGLVSAWYDTFRGNFYPFHPPNLYNISAARRHPNISTSVPFAGGTSQPWNFTVSLAEVPAQGNNATKVPDARVLLTLYDVHPPANWTGQQNPGPSMPVQYPDAHLDFAFTWRVTYWPFSVAATNACTGSGDCAGVINPTCLRQLSKLNQSSAVTPLDTPACENVTSRWGGLASCK